MHEVQCQQSSSFYAEKENLNQQQQQADEVVKSKQQWRSQQELYAKYGSEFIAKYS